MPTAFLQPSVIDQHLLTELEKGHLPGLFSKYPLANLHISGFRIIAKKYQPGKWRLIFDLSSPQGHSVNDGIPKDPFSAQYMKADNIIDHDPWSRSSFTRKPTHGLASYHSCIFSCLLPVRHEVAGGILH